MASTILEIQMYRSLLSIPTRKIFDHVPCRHDMYGWLGIEGTELGLLALSCTDGVMAIAGL